jgi:TfoX/Sxy family transcriptional regulator of competence genes
MKAFDPMGSPMNGYWQVPPDVIEDADELASWVREALDVAGRGRKRPKKSRTKQGAKSARSRKKGRP